jgi:hypothetical protein
LVGSWKEKNVGICNLWTFGLFYGLFVYDFYGLWVYFVVIGYGFPHFGMLHQNLAALRRQPRIFA